jgi:glucose-6-phosphate dehydrogenase assembly protein OpcA
VFERVVLRPKGADPSGYDTLVIPLLIPHLQSVLWWIGDADIEHSGLRSLLSICDHLVVDSAIGPADRLQAISALAAASGPGRPRTSPNLVVGDLTWSRIDGFRSALAQVFDEGHRAACLEGLQEIEIVGVRKASDPYTAAEVVFAGWIASRLGCHNPEKTRRGVTMQVAASGARAEVIFSARPATTMSGRDVHPPLHGVRLKAHHKRHDVEVELAIRRGAAELRIAESGTAPHKRSVPLALLPESEVLSRELGRIGRDRVLEDALLSAARILVARAA